jgi:hypothetical protein
LPDDFSDIIPTADGFEARLSLPVDDDGFFGRECPGCQRFFKMRADEYGALPDGIALHCSYCGHRADHGDFMTADQRHRSEAGLQALTEQFVHDQVHEMLSGIFGSGARSPRRPSSGSFVEITTSYTPSPPPPVPGLPTYVEEQVRRTIACPSCSNHYAVYGASAFCPVCGPRPAAATVLESIDAARTALAVEDRVSEDVREQLRVDGVLDRFAADAVESSVTAFEVFAREQFERRVPTHATVLKGKGNVFQRLDDTDALFAAHAGFALTSVMLADLWDRLRIAFAQRHVLIHLHGLVDQRYLNQVPGSTLTVGQRLVVRRAEAGRTLDDLTAAIKAIDAVP